MRRNHHEGFLRYFFQPTFILSVCLLLAMGLFLDSALAKLAGHFEKRAAPLQQSLREFTPKGLASFQEGWEVTYQDASNADIDTDEYFYLVFDRNDKAILPNHLEFFVTFYNDPEDKVPHTPDVCSRQGGARVIELRPIHIKVPGFSGDLQEVPAQLFIYQNPGVENHAYDIFFFYTCDTFRRTRNEVRLILGNPFRRDVYFSKIEVATRFEPGVDLEPYHTTCQKLISESLPILLSEFYPALAASND